MRRLLPWTFLLWVACAPAPESPAPAPELPTSAPETSAPEPEIREARAQIMPGGMGAVYFSIVNPGAESDRLLAAATPAARAAEIHQTVDEDGVMRMVPHPGGVEIPAGGTVDFAPGGLHVMLIEAALPEGAEKLLLSLDFERGGTIEVEAAVMRMGAMEHGAMEH